MSKKAMSVPLSKYESQADSAHQCSVLTCKVVCADCSEDMCGDNDEVIRYIKNGKRKPLCGGCYSAARKDDGYCATCLEHIVPMVGDSCLQCMLGEAEAVLEAVS